MTTDQMDPTQLEEVAQVLADVLHAAEDSRWAAGDVLLSLGENCPPLRTLGGMLGCSAAYLSTLRTVARTFAPDERAQDQKWQLHRLAACDEDPVATLEHAISMGWSSADLQNDLVERGVLTKRVPESDRAVIECPNCGWKVTKP